MSTCNLSTTAEYPLNSVQLDKGTGKYIAHLSQPPTSCADGVFTSKGLTVNVDPNITVARLTYNGHPIALIPSQGFVQTTNTAPESSFGLGTFLILALIIGAIYYAWTQKWFGLFNTPPTSTPSPVTPTVNNSTTTSSIPPSNVTPLVAATSDTGSYRRGGTSRYDNALSATAPAPASFTSAQTVTQPSTVVVHDNSGSGLLTGMMIGSMMNNHNNGYGGGETIIHDREVIHDHDSGNSDRNYSSDDRQSSSSSYAGDSDRSAPSTYQSDDSDSKYSGDSSPSYSSDSSPSYESDNGSSYSSDSSSGSDYSSSSSDSGGSFGSD